MVACILVRVELSPTGLTYPDEAIAAYLTCWSKMFQPVAVLTASLLGLPGRTVLVFGVVHSMDTDFHYGG